MRVHYPSSQNLCVTYASLVTIYFIDEKMMYVVKSILLIEIFGGIQ